MNACDPGMLGEELGDMAGIEGALCVAFHTASHTSAPALETELYCE